jgi:hypothetical protein
MSQASTAFNITGMTCGNCVRHVQETLGPLGAVTVGLIAPQAACVNAYAGYDLLVAQCRGWGMVLMAAWMLL